MWREKKLNYCSPFPFFLEYIYMLSRPGVKIAISNILSCFSTNIDSLFILYSDYIFGIFIDFMNLNVLLFQMGSDSQFYSPACSHQ